MNGHRRGETGCRLRSASSLTLRSPGFSPRDRACREESIRRPLIHHGLQPAVSALCRAFDLATLVLAILGVAVPDPRLSDPRPTTLDPRPSILDPSTAAPTTVRQGSP